jgi:hypothetical protein
MPKSFGGTTAATAAPSQPRPMPRPADLGGAMSGQPAAQSNGIFGSQPSMAGYENALEMLKSAMQGAAASNSPALAFLTPIIGSMTGAKINDKMTALQKQQGDQMTQGLLGGGLSDRAQSALDVLQNPDAPAYLKSIASSMFNNETKQTVDGAPKARRSSGRSSSSGSSRPARLTYIARDPDGITRGYNAATGKREVVPNADAPAPAALPVPPDTPSMPADPSTLTDDELLGRY